MKVMTILGSPRRYGNTAQVLEWVEHEMGLSGHAVDRANIWELEIGHCKESHQCRYPQSSACGAPDDAAAIFERMLDADAVLFASPVFSWGFPAPFKALIDRLYCLSGYHQDPGHAILLDDKPLAMLMTCGGGETENLDLMSRVFRNLVGFWGARDAGFLLVPDATTPENLGAGVQARTMEFARSIVERAAC